jgi:hypothetical protein
MLNENKVSTLDQDCHSEVNDGANYRDYEMGCKQLWFCKAWIQNFVVVALIFPEY